jgi:lipopolysaccharide transport system ATP-binding protein
MTRREVARKFDEIVAFAEVDDFIDTPVKRYSSGMYVRLAFAVAAHLETDVLLVDEVLAVGDATFQRKSLGRMGDVAKGGKTVLFVSHNLAAMRNLCNRAIVFERGNLAFDGGVAEGLNYYERSFSTPGGIVADAYFHGPLSDDLRFDQLVCRQGGAIVDVLDPTREFQVELRGFASKPFPALELKIGVFRDGLFLASCHDTPHESGMREGAFVSRFDILGDVFRPGRYSIGVGAAAAIGSWVWGSDVAVLDFSENRAGRSAERNAGIIAIPHSGSRVQLP